MLVNVIVGFNEARCLELVLSSASSLFDRVIYIDSSSQDESLLIASSLGIEVHCIKKVSAAHARNWAITNTSINSSDIVFFSDADVLLSDEFVHDASNSIAKREADFVFGVKYDLSDGGYFLKTTPRKVRNPSFLGGNFCCQFDTLRSNALKFDTQYKVEEERQLLINIYKKNLSVLQIPSFQGYHLNWAKGSIVRQGRRVRYFWYLYVKSMLHPKVHLTIFWYIDLIVIGAIGTAVSLTFLLVLAFVFLRLSEMHQLGVLRNLDFRKW